MSIPTPNHRAADVGLMPPTTKEVQRGELHKTIWRIANDLRLPAELAARRQQYAHYRDRLLSFREAA